MQAAVLKTLACPRDQGELFEDNHDLVCLQGHRYAIADGVPILTSPEAATKRTKVTRVDPVVQALLVSTCGNLYRGCTLPRYPIPHFRFPGTGLLLDVGCGWGRWSFSAVNAGYTVIGIDESLQRVLAARRVARDLGIDAEFLVADARCLPFRPETFDVVFSYSVLQHLSKNDTATSVRSIRSVLKSGARSYVQMANIAGLRSFTNYLRLPPPTGFNVRYWRLSEMRRVFSFIGETEIQTDGFFGLNVQASDLDILPFWARTIIRSSECLRRLPLTPLADSVYVNSVKKNS